MCNKRKKKQEKKTRKHLHKILHTPCSYCCCCCQSARCNVTALNNKTKQILMLFFAPLLTRTPLFRGKWCIHPSILFFCFSVWLAQRMNEPLLILVFIRAHFIATFAKTYSQRHWNNCGPLLLAGFTVICLFANCIAPWDIMTIFCGAIFLLPAFRCYSLPLLLLLFMRSYAEIFAWKIM